MKYTIFLNKKKSNIEYCTLYITIYANVFIFNPKLTISIVSTRLGIEENKI